MVRSFDGDGDGALTARDVETLMEHFAGDRFERSERLARERAETQAAETARFDALAAESRSPRVVQTLKSKGRRGAPRRGGGKGGRGEEIQARGTKDFGKDFKDFL